MASNEFDYLLSMVEEEPKVETEVVVDNIDKVEVETTIVDDDKVIIANESLIPGMEQYDYFSSLLSNKKENKVNVPQMNPAMGRQGPPPMPIFIRRTGNNYRIWLRAEHWFTNEYINRITRFLDSRSKEDTVTIYLGNKLPNEQTCIVGAIVSAILSCRCPVKAVATGSCGVPETMLFCFCKEREMRRYSALYFGSTEILQDMPMYEGYLATFYERAVQLGLLSKEDVTEIWNTNSEKVIYYDEFARK